MRSRVLASLILIVMAGCLGGPIPGGTPGTSTTMSTTSGSDGVPSTASTPLETPSVTFLIEGRDNVSISVEIADSPQERQRGLMDRESLASRHGMLFVYGEEQELSFWMKNTSIPLDIIFIDERGVVINVAHAKVPANTSSDGYRQYESTEPAKYVIEVNRGFVNTSGVVPGTRIAVRGPPSVLTPEGSD